MDTQNILILAGSAAFLGIVIYLMYREATAAGYSEQCAEEKKGWHGKKQ